MQTQSVSRLLKAVVAILISLGISSNSLIASEGKHFLNDTNPVIGKIESKPVYLQSLEDKKINDLRKQLYDAITLKLKVEALVNLGKKHAKYKVPTQPEVTDKEVSDFYHANNLTSKGTLKELAPEIKYYIGRYKMQQMQGMIDKLYQDAVRAGLVTQYIQAPNDFLITVPLETGFIRNSSKAKVMFLEFSDYQCPACRSVQPVISQLRAKYDKKVIFAYRHFPLSFHTEADEAAIATECAREQDKFESFHQYFFSNQSELAREKNRLNDYFINIAKKLGVEDTKKFNTCIERQKYRDLVQNDLDTGMAIGVSGTPAFIIGIYDPKTKKLKGEIKTGGLPLSGFEKLLQKYL